MTVTALAAQPVSYRPGDCALLIGPAEVLTRRLDALAVAGLRPALLCTGPGEPPQGLRALAGEPASITGWMGAFRAELAGPQGGMDLGPLSWHADGHFDWVLDFGHVPVGAVPPPGYYRLDADDFPAFKASLLQIARCLRDGFEKPRYFRMDAALCAHRRQGIDGCRACLDACPAQAITGLGEAVAIEAHLCKGCGACALVCPSGAVRQTRPGTPHQLERLATMLAAWHGAGGGEVGLWIVPAGRQAEPPATWLSFAVEEVGSLGLEFWLTALTLGCGRVAIDAAGLLPATRDAVADQVAWARTLLVGLGYPEAVALAETVSHLADVPSLSGPMTSGPIPLGDDKRALLLAAVDGLVAQASTAQVAAGGPLAGRFHGVASGTPSPLPAVVSLPPGPLGETRVAGEGCTLCATCVRLCPTGAFSLPGSTSQLAFTEERCVQCGLCVSACPEKILLLVPRLLTDPAVRRAPRVVAEAERVVCSDCGQPFTTRTMLARSQALMVDHPMFQGANGRLMTLCPDCRQKAMAGGTVLTT